MRSRKQSSSDRDVRWKGFITLKTLLAEQNVILHDFQQVFRSLLEHLPNVSEVQALLSDMDIDLVPHDFRGGCLARQHPEILLNQLWENDEDDGEEAFGVDEEHFAFRCTVRFANLVVCLLGNFPDKIKSLHMQGTTDVLVSSARKNKAAFRHIEQFRLEAKPKGLRDMILHDRRTLSATDLEGGIRALCDLTPNLQHLHIGLIKLSKKWDASPGGHWEVSRSAWLTVFWPHLRTVVFENVKVSAKDLCTFLTGHASSLRYLSLFGCDLADTNQFRGWRQLVEVVREDLHLRSIHINEWSLSRRRVGYHWPRPLIAVPVEGDLTEEQIVQNTQLHDYLLHRGCWTQILENWLHG